MRMRNMIGAGCLLAFALVIAGCSGGVTGSPIGPPPPPAVPSASISFCDMASCTPGTTFNIYSVRNLSIKVNWTNLPEGEHSQRVNLLLPNGDLYMTFNDGLALVSGAGQVDRRLSVVGTPIWAQGLSGAWRVEAYLNDGTTPVATATLNLTE